MNLDPRIIEGKRVLTPFDIREAEQFNGYCSYFSNVTDDFNLLENAAYGVLDLTFGETPYRYINDEGETSNSGCLYFLPEQWVRKEFDRGIILDVCHDVKIGLADLCGKRVSRGRINEPKKTQKNERKFSIFVAHILLTKH